MTTRPTDTPEWSTTGAIIEPAPAKQSAGWLAAEPPPHQFVNWAWNRFALWAAHFATAASKFTTLAAAFVAPAAAPLSVGDTFVLDEYDGGNPGDVAIANVAGAATPAGVISLGREVLYQILATGVVHAYARDGSGLIRTYTPAAVGASGFNADDLFVVTWRITGGVGEIEVFARATGASLFTFAHGAGVTNCSLGVDRVFVAGGNPGAGEYVRALSISGLGAVVWNYNHGAVVSAVVPFGRYLYLRAGVSAHASLATMRAIQASNGFDAAGEGGLGVSILPGVWDSAALGGLAAGDARRTLATDGRIVVTRDALDLRIVRCLDGVIHQTIAGVVVVGSMFDLDDDLLLVVVPSGASNVTAYSRADGMIPVWRYVPAAGAVDSASTDGAGIFVANDTGGAELTPRIRRGNRPRLWRRVDPAVDTGLPYRRGAI